MISPSPKFQPFSPSQKSTPLGPFLFRVFSFPILFSPGKEVEKALGILREAGQCPGFGFSVPILLICRRSKWMQKVLQLGEQEPIYIGKTKKQPVRILDFLFLCLFFYKYPQALSGAWIWSRCANFLLVPKALIKITHPGTLPELTFMWSSEWASCTCL